MAEEAASLIKKETSALWCLRGEVSCVQPSVCSAMAWQAGGSVRPGAVGWVELVPGLMGFATAQPILRKRGIGTAAWGGAKPITPGEANIE